MTQESVEVVLPRFPLRLFGEWQERFYDVVREFALIRITAEQAGDDLPRRLVDLATEVDERFSDAVEAVNAARSAALARGERAIDLRYVLPADVAVYAARLEEVMAEVDDYCVQEQLLVLRAPLELLAFRHWFFGNLVRQSCGHPPVPWSGPL